MSAPESKVVQIHRGAMLVASFAFIALGAAARAEPLNDMVDKQLCSSIVGETGTPSPNCTRETSPPGLAVKLRAERKDIDIAMPMGALFGEAPIASLRARGAFVYNGSLAPEVWRLTAGDRLRVQLVNGLEPGRWGATNLHTHGLLTPPTLRAGADGVAMEPVGDTSFVCTVPATEPTPSVSDQPCVEHGALFGANRAEMTFDMPLPADHPEGLYWYHPHVHHNSEAQVSGGMAGLIVIKGRAGGKSGGPRAPGGAPLVERDLMLKDLQIGDLKPSAADPARFEGDTLIGEERPASDLACRGTGGEVPKGACFDAAAGQAWLFTVNGLVFPQTTLAPTDRQIWRIGNASSDVTYDLALVEAASGRPLRVQILAVDGGPIPQPAAGGAFLMAEHVLLMPGSRVEIAVDRATAQGVGGMGDALQVRLRSSGYDTGDEVWPAVDLMDVTFAADPAIAARENDPAVLALQKEQRPPRELLTPAEPLVVDAWKPTTPVAPASGTSTPSAPKRPMAMRAMPGMSRLDPAMSPTPVEDCSPLRPGEDRYVALTGGDFGKSYRIGVGHGGRPGGKPDPALVQDVAQKARPFDASVSVCAHAGTVENWTVANVDADGSEEMHNFHIHQMKFNVIGVIDPRGRVVAPDPKDVFDTFPVPINGSIRIRLAFTSAQEGGLFMFHCHVLDHEDKGMMAVIRVVGPIKRGRG